MISKLCSLIGRMPKDKILHFLVCYIGLDICLSLGQYLNLGNVINYIISFVLISLILFGKEYIDKKKYNGWDWKDIIAGYIGVILKTGVFVIQVI